jgi:hypothetical protein
MASMGFLSKTARRSWLSENKAEFAHALLSVNELEFLTHGISNEKGFSIHRLSVYDMPERAVPEGRNSQDRRYNRRDSNQ